MLASVRVVLLTACVGSGACSWLSEPPATVTPAQLPQGELVFQPRFHFAAGEPTYQGTGFFVRSGTSVVAVTSSHYLRPRGPRLLKAEWLQVAGDRQQVVAAFSRSFGKPALIGEQDPDDLRSDYLLGAVETKVPEGAVLELDERPRPQAREPVWLPNKSPSAPRGYRLIEGRVVSASRQLITIELQRIALESQSGSPVISRTTGKVIGTLSRSCGEEDGKLRLSLAPARAILDAIAAARERPALADVVGR